MNFYRQQTELDGSVRHELLGYLRAEADYIGNWHSHPFTETLYVVSGLFCLEYKNETIQLRQGQAVLIRPQLRHRVTSCERSSLLYIGCSYIRAGEPLLFPATATLMVDASAVLSQFEYVALAYQNTPALSVDHATALLMPLDPFFHALAKNDNAPLGNDILIERVKEYLYHHPDEQIIVADLAEKFYISPQYLGNKFRKYTGKTIKQYHADLRMKRALYMIERSSLSLSEIADRLGFNTLQYFSTCFKAHFGISPRSIVKSFNNRND